MTKLKIKFIDKQNPKQWNKYLKFKLKKRPKIKISIGIDDLHPEKNWGLQTDICINFLEKLNNEFGAKFTLFIPSNYHNKYPISHYKDWINFFISKDIYECAAHGHFHQTFHKNSIGECEFSELTKIKDINERITLIKNEWEKIGIKELGWRSPGWITHPKAAKELSKNFKYIAAHPTIDKKNPYKGPTISTACSIETKKITVSKYGISLQSHINGKTNTNNWTKENYKKCRDLLLELQKNFILEFVTISKQISSY